MNNVQCLNNGGEFPTRNEFNDKKIVPEIHKANYLESYQKILNALSLINNNIFHTDY